MRAGRPSPRSSPAKRKKLAGWWSRWIPGTPRGAAPPVGTSPPTTASARPSSDVSAVDSPCGPASPQPLLDSTGSPVEQEIVELFRASAAGFVETYGEDCLTVNVWTPSTEGGRRPVLVWFHGGGWTLGSGNVPSYDGTRLAAR